ncbi:unnamed protein product [Caenorhabditis sp. 36 PRJEB53466]|nr:unnamed protein product [Caenorhabditis sp. 36 PRJEB53466]
MNLKFEKPTKEDTWLIKPIPGFVCKWKNVKIDGLLGEETQKCFVNVCHCKELPPPMKDLDPEQLAEMFDKKDRSYTIPMTVGELDCVKDRKEANSIKIDVVVNSIFYEKRLASIDATFFRHLVSLFFCSMIEEKHGFHLDPMDAVMLRNRTFVGELEMQNVQKTPAKRVVEEVEADEEVEEIKQTMFGMQKIDGVTINLLDGKRLEVSMLCEKGGKAIDNPRRLKLKMTPTRCFVMLDQRQHFLDFGLPFEIDVATAESKFVAETKNLVVSADIVI